MVLAMSRIIPVGLAVAAVLGLFTHQGSGSFGVATAAAQDTASPTAPTFERGTVYLLRGFGNIWSRGLDEFGKELDDVGIRNFVLNHRHWKRIAIEAEKRYFTDEKYAPIIVIGHSLGVNGSLLLAERLAKARIPIRLIVAFEAIARDSDTKFRVPANVEEVLNFYKSGVLGIELIPGRGFAGKLENFDTRGVAGTLHYKIDKNLELRALVKALVIDTLIEEQVDAASN